MGGHETGGPGAKLEVCARVPRPQTATDNNAEICKA